MCAVKRFLPKNKALAGHAAAWDGLLDAQDRLKTLSK